MDYDASTVPEQYAVARNLAPATLRRWLDVIADTIQPARLHRILDLGCGTGRFSSALHQRFSANVLGVDPSHRMLSQAPRLSGVRYVRAAAEALPLAESAFDMVFISMVWHHFLNKQAAAAQIRRVLCADGILCVRTSTAETLDSCLYLKFFPEARQIIEAALPARQILLQWAANQGFALLRHICVVQEVDRDPIDYCARIEKRAISDLACIPDAAFQRGLDSLRRYCADLDEASPAEEAIDLFVFR